MSYILESIKKSDERRQARPAATVMSDVSLHDVTYQPEALHILLRRYRGYVIALLMLLLLVIGWYEYRDDGLFFVDDSGQHYVQTQGNDGVSVRVPIKSIDAVPAHDAPSVDTLGAQAVETLAVADEELSLYRSLDSAPRDSPSESSTRQVSSLYRQQEEQPVIEAVARAPQKETLPPEKEVQAVAPEPLINDVQTVAPEPRIIVNNNASSKRTENADIPSIYDLPVSTRDTIPSIHYQAHIYASDNHSGFVILNWEKLRSGDKVPGGMHVEKVESDGVVLSYNGVVFLLPAMKSWKPTLPVYEE